MNKIIGSLIFILSISHAFSAEYDLQYIMDEAVKSSQSLNIQALRQDNLNEMLKQKKAMYQPSVNVGGSWKYLSETATVSLDLPAALGGSQNIDLGLNNQFDTYAEVKYLLFDGFARKYAIKSLNSMKNRSLLQQQELERHIRLNTLQAAFSYRIMSLTIASLESSLQRLDLNRQRIQSFYDLGFSSDLDLLEIDNKMDEVRLSVKVLESRRSLLILTLVNLSGLENLTVVNISPDYEIIKNPPSQDRTNSEMISLSLYQIKLQEEESLEAIKKVKLSAQLPLVSTAGSFHYGIPGANFAGSEWQPWFTLGIGISWSAWDGGSVRSTVRQAGNDLSVKMEEKAALLRELSLEARRLHSDLYSLKDQITLSSQIEGRKKESYHLIQKFWETGQNTILDVLDAEQEWTESELRRQRLKWQYLSEYQSLISLLNLNNS